LTDEVLGSVFSKHLAFTSCFTIKVCPTVPFLEQRIGVQGYRVSPVTGEPPRSLALKLGEISTAGQMIHHYGVE